MRHGHPGTQAGRRPGLLCSPNSARRGGARAWAKQDMWFARASLLDWSSAPSPPARVPAVRNGSKKSCLKKAALARDQTGVVMSALSVGSTTPDKKADGGADDGDTDSGPGAKFVKWIPGDALTFYAGILSLDAVAKDNPSINPSDAASASTSTSVAAPAAVAGTQKVQLTDAQIRDIDESSFAWFGFAMLAAIALVVLGANSREKRARRTQRQLRLHRRLLIVRCALAAVAFLIWASLIPKSWPNNLEVVQDMGAAYPLVIAVIGVMFTYLAEAATTRASRG